MFKKTVATLMLTGLASGQAFALSNADFEAGTTAGWLTINGTMSVGTYGSTPIDVYDEFASVMVNSDVLSSAGLPAAAGSYFGLLTAGPVPSTSSSSAIAMQGFSANLSGAALATGGDLFIKMYTADDYYAAAGYNDGFEVYGDGASLGAYDATTMLSDNSGNAIGISPWVTFSVAAGTQNLMITFSNYYDGVSSNAPQFAIDFTPTAPVPEADSVAMMMAGLGVLGMVARRRRAGKAV